MYRTLEKDAPRKVENIESNSAKLLTGERNEISFYYFMFDYFEIYSPSIFNKSY